MNTSIEPAEYCRQLETYLCRKNEGHLIRIVGPVFEQVCEWAMRGVPLTIAYRGIDQYCERYYAKGSRRRPVRIEFCEADILDLFDEWRRAVGVTTVAPAGDRAEPTLSGTDASTGRRDTLPGHLERIITRLTAARAGAARSERFHRLVDEAVREVDRIRPEAKHARGDDRRALIDRLAELDRTLVAAAAAELGDTRTAALRTEAEAEIAPFAIRMPADARSRAVDVAFERLVREEIGLPVLTFE
ncbi:MAG: hypothetical protein DMF84_19530 [Acidobacteria bacterium]|nr:MAG: hypothetical protein DMF84_19530 [Acidobacteriota bacterium]